MRVSSQLTDGVFQVALAGYVVFSPERAPTPGAIAGALAVVLLPFSVLGPFVGVFLDRWSRRQVLVWSNLVRVGLVGLLAAAAQADLRGPALFAVILVCLSVNRFLLAGLSAALPHVVRREDLVTANALTPTAGTIAALVGAGLGAGLRSLHGDVMVLVVAALMYGAAGGLALRIPRDLLGPDADPQRPGAREALGNAARGLVAGLRHLEGRRPAAYALAAIGVHRFCFGIWTVTLVLVYRDLHPSDPDAAFAGLALAVGVSGAGFLAAAVLTPVATLRFPARVWVVALLLAAGLTQVFPASLFTEPALLVAAFVLGLTSQGVKIVVDTVVQTQVDDVFRGRVFSLYDVLFNVAFVAAAAVAGVALPADGRSRPVLVAVAAIYALTAACYAAVTRQRHTRSSR